MKTAQSFRVPRHEAQTLLTHYIHDARACVKSHLAHRRGEVYRDDAAKSQQSAADWLRWAKQSGGEAQRWAKKLGVTLGRKPKATTPAV